MFVPAGLHPPTAERRHLVQIVDAGADLFEVGLAHHDAHLDGPVIQTAYRHALSRGQILDRTLRAAEHAARLRPTVVMTYWEPVSRHGPEHLARQFADAVTALAQRLADIPTPAGPTPTELGTDAAFIPLTQLMGTAGRRMSSGVVATEVPKDRCGTMERKQSNG